MRTLVYLPLVLGALVAGSCRDPNVPDLNNPSLDDLLTNPTRAKVATAAQGLLVGARTNIAEYNGYVSELGVFGRESYIFDPGDNRFETELLFGPLDPGGPRFGGNLWVVRFANIRAASNVLSALDNPVLIDMTAAEKEAARGFAQTLQALDFLEVINTRDTIGAPIAVSQPLGAPLAPILPRDSVFNHIVRLLDSADTHLAAASAAFSFGLSPGFAGFDTPATFRKFNRALKARVQVYRGAIFTCAACFTDALTLLTTGATFVDTTPGFKLAAGVYHSFGTGSGDLTNGLYDPTPAKLFAHPSLRDSAETQQASVLLDRRLLTKTVAVTSRTYGQHTSNLGFTRYASNTDLVPIIRNEELILLRAEANRGLGNLLAAGQDINFIRVNSGNLAPIAALGAQTADSVLRVLIKQKRYSLLFEGGHSWIDHRHYFASGANLPPTGTLRLFNQVGDQVFLLMPVPLDECLPRPRPSRGCP
jgi:hypothetical protein